MVTLPLPGRTATSSSHHRANTSKAKKVGATAAPTAFSSSSSSSLTSFKKGSSSSTTTNNNNNNNNKKAVSMRLLHHHHRGAIRLQDSIEEEEEDRYEQSWECGGGGGGGAAATDWPTPSQDAGLPVEDEHNDVDDPPKKNSSGAGKAKEPRSGGGPTRGLLKLAAVSTSKRSLGNPTFLRLNNSSSSDAGSSSASALFDVNNNNATQYSNSRPDASLHSADGTAPSSSKDVGGGEDTTDATKTTKSKKQILASKLKLNFKGTKASFQRLENVEGSHSMGGYVPPSDYASFVGGGHHDGTTHLGSTALQLLQIASQSHYAQPSPRLQDVHNPVERRTESAQENGGRDTTSQQREDVEFRQFVFDKNFSTIEAVNVEKSDSGTANDDIFRMAAVETVTRMSLAKFGGGGASPASFHNRGLRSSPSPKQQPPPKTSRFSPASRRSDAPKPFSPASGMLPKSPHRPRNNAAPIRASPAPKQPSRVGDDHKPSPSDDTSPSFDDFSKKRFQDLVKRNGKLSVQSPLSSSSLAHSASSRDGAPFGSTSRHGPSLQQPRSASTTANVSNTRQDAGTNEGPSSKPGRNNRGGATLAEASHSSFGAGASPLGTRHHFGNSGGQRSAVPKSSQLVSELGSKTRAARVNNAFSSVVSTASVANATVSTGPDENQRGEKVGWPAARPDRFQRPSTSHFDINDDNDNPFRIGQDDPWKDAAAWDVGKVTFPVVGRSQASGKTTTGSTASSASRGDNSLLIQSIRSAIHQKSRATRHREAQVHRPDPSPRGVPHSSSDSFLDFVPAKQGGRSGKGQLVEHDDIVTSKSDGAMDVDLRTLGSAPIVSASPVTMARISSHARKQPSKAPSGVPEHAILASMLFRQTEVFQQNDELDANDSQGPGASSKQLKQVHPKPRPPTEPSSVHHRFDVPAAVHTSSAASIVSSVTEEASVFYSKNLQTSSSSYKSQVQTALNNYHNLRAKQQHQQQSKYHVPSVGNGGTHPQRGPFPPQQPQSQPPPRKWAGSSSSSRKTTTSSTGRPTWLDRVEKEHMRMFS